MAKQDDYTRYTIRVPGALYERVAQAAEANQRSVNAEILARLDRSPMSGGQGLAAEHLEALKEIEAALRVLVDLTVAAGERLADVESSVDGLKAIVGTETFRLAPPPPDDPS